MIIMDRHITFSLYCFLILSWLFSGCGKTPEEVFVSSISLSQPIAEMVVGESIQLSATVLPSNATDKNVTWASTKVSVATVSNTGIVTAIAEGNTTITASAGGKSTTCSVTVGKGAVSVTAITLNKSELSLIEGESETLVATVLPDDATDKSVTWSSSNSGVASIDKGKVTALNEGETTIIAKAGVFSASCIVSVSKRIVPVESISLNKSELNLIEGETETLVATVLPDDATDKNVIWSSSDDSVAYVKGGTVQAVKKGTATITAKAGDKSTTCLVSVKSDPQNDPIQFADSRVKELLVSAFDTSGDGELSYKEAKEVESIEGVFSTAKAISSFDEFQYFTSVKAIPSNCFENSLLGSIVLPASILQIKDGAFSGCAKLSNVVLNENLTSISWGAFSGCIGLKQIVLPPTVNSLGTNTFNGCTNLETVYLPDGLKTIPNHAFSGCQNLYTISIPSSLESIETEAFSDCKKLTSFDFPSSLKAIHSYAFHGSGLITVIIPDTVESIDMGVFSSCSNLVEITLPHYMTVIPSSFLERCNKLVSIDIPSTVMTISRYAFQHTGLTSVIIPANVARIDDYAFYQCDKMKSVTVLAESVPQGGGDMFGGINIFNTINYPIYVPSASVEAYKAAPFWKDYANRIFPISNNSQ